MEKYLDSSLSPAERAEDLLSKMTLEEKIKQLQCTSYTSVGEANNKFEDGSGEVFIGDLVYHDSAEQTAKAVRKAQEEVMNSSRFRIPAVFHNEALSGPLFKEATSFPTSLSLGASFDPELVQNMADLERRQMMALGYRHALSPVLDQPRDMRWGRLSETYGNDPTLSAAMSVAFVKGLQTDDLKNGVSATAKHFLGYSQSEGGLNMNKTVVDERDLREVYAKPFEAAIRKAGIGTIMNSYSEINGRPVTASKEILTDLLRDDLGFTGPVVSDYGSIPRVIYSHRVAETLKEAAAQCLEAGMDMECPNPFAYSTPLLEAVKEGRISEETVDVACRRILEFKFRMGVFEDYMPHEEEIENAFRAPENWAAAKRAADRTMTLTKNDGILPFSEEDRKLKVAVIGPTAEYRRFMYSGYTFATLADMNIGKLEMIGTEAPRPRLALDPLAEKGVPKRTYPFTAEQAMEWIDKRLKEWYPGSRTIFEALKDIFPEAVYVRGCSYLNKEETDFDAAVKAASEADLVILTVGSKCGWGSYVNHAEGFDTRTYGLPAAQNELVSRVLNVAKKSVIVHTDSRPLIHQEAYEKADAILETWLPNTTGEKAIADTLTGKNNPAGRLPYDVPYDEGMMPFYHYAQNGSHEFCGGGTAGLYNDSPKNIHRPFGFGLSYTTFSYGEVALESDNALIPTLKISVDVTNTGDRAGDEVVQLYCRDLVGSMIRPFQELAGFRRITLQPGETKKVTFTVRMDQFAFRNVKKNWILEAGEFVFYVGPDSRNRAGMARFTQPETVEVDYTKRGFFADTEEA